MMRDKFLSIGEPLVAFGSEEIDKTIADTATFKKFAAGEEFNVCLGLSRLKHDVSYATRLGKDPFGNFLLSELKKNNIHTEYVTFTEM